MHIPISDDRVIGSIELLDVVYPDLRYNWERIGVLQRAKRTIPVYRGLNEYRGVLAVEDYYPAMENWNIYIPLDASLLPEEAYSALKRGSLNGTLPDLEGYKRVVFEGTRVDLSRYAPLVFPETVLPCSDEGLRVFRRGSLPVAVPPIRGSRYRWGLAGYTEDDAGSDMWFAYLGVTVKQRAVGEDKRPKRYDGYTVRGYEEGMRKGYWRTLGLLRVQGAFPAPCGCGVAPLCRSCLQARLQRLYGLLGDPVGLARYGARRMAEDELAKSLPPSLYPRAGFVFT